MVPLLSLSNCGKSILTKEEGYWILVLDNEDSLKYGSQRSFEQLEYLIWQGALHIVR
jgi:hypothetical protein